MRLSARAWFRIAAAVQYDEPGAVSGNALLDALNYPDKAETDGVIEPDRSETVAPAST